MANRVRGETEITLGSRKIIVTLGLRALAELEDEFDAGSFEEVLARLFAGSIKARDMMRFLAAVLRGNGADPDDPEIRQAIDALTPQEFATMAQRIFQRSGLSDPAEAEDGDGAGRPLAAPSGGGSGSK